MIGFRSSSFVGIALLVAAALPTQADTLNGNGSWQSWSAATLGTASSPTYGGPYWNNKSGQGPAGNVGWCLIGGGDCSMPNPPGALPFFGNGNTAVPTMSFSSTGSGSAVDVSLAGVFTTQTTPAIGLDYFGYYLLDSSGIVTSPTRLFSVTDPLGTAKSFSVGPNTKYGFYLENVQGQGTSLETDYWFFMDSNQDTTNRGIPLTPFQHAAVFQNGATGYYVGFEDCISTADDNCDRDYNDMIVKVGASAVPEPAAPILASTGLLSIALLLGGKKHKRS